MSCTASIPGSVEYADHSDTTPVQSCVSDWFTSCRNPLWALDHQDQCGAVTVAKLDLIPPSLQVAKGKTGYVRLIATFEDGRMADVTGEGIFAIDGTAAQSNGAGLIAGLDVGTAPITGTWRGLLATGTVTVFDNACAESRPWDVVICADDGAIYQSSVVQIGGLVGGVVLTRRALRRSVSPRADMYPHWAMALQAAMDLYDSNDYDPRAGWTIQGGLRPSIGQRTGTDRICFSQDIVDGAAAWSDKIKPFTADTRPIGQQLMSAYALHSLGRTNVRKVVVVYTTGGESLCNPSLSAAAASLKGAGIHVAIVTPLNSEDQVFSFCNQPQTAYSVLQAASSTCLFFDQTTGNGAGNVMAQTLRIACEGCGVGYSGGGIGIGNI